MKAAFGQEGVLEGHYTYNHTIEMMKALQKSTLQIAGTNVSTLAHKLSHSPLKSKKNRRRCAGLLDSLALEI